MMHAAVGGRFQHRRLLSSSLSSGALIRRGWGGMRSSVLVPALRAAVMLCMLMSVMVLLEKVGMGAISHFVKLACCSPDRAHRWKPLSLAAAADEETGNIFVGSNHQPEPHS